MNKGRPEPGGPQIPMMCRGCQNGHLRS